MVGYDLDNSRINDLNLGKDRTLEVDQNVLNDLLHSDVSKIGKGLYITSNIELISDTDIFIITVPTPIKRNKNNKPV